MKKIRITREGLFNPGPVAIGTILKLKSEIPASWAGNYEVLEDTDDKEFVAGSENTGADDADDQSEEGNTPDDEDSADDSENDADDEEEEEASSNTRRNKRRR